MITARRQRARSSFTTRLKAWCLSRTKNNRGMTLAEMLVVLILIGLLSGGVAVIGTAGVRMANREAFRRGV
jgi:prepilin-type N-terminal cleavage/methylation domain-containing protein